MKKKEKTIEMHLPKQRRFNVKVIKLFENGFMNQEFAFGGENKEGLSKDIKYPSSLQNFLIDTGKEVILVDTGYQNGFPEPKRNDATPIYMGTKIDDYLAQLEKLGYKPSDIDYILVTHKHPDHTGALSYFENAKIVISQEDYDSLGIQLKNVVIANYLDGPYYNFPRAQKITDHLYFVEAKGHTKGNSIVIAEENDYFYMFHGDITYTDEALYENKLSVVYEDIVEARKSLDNVREFVKNHKTIYLSTHTPYGVKNLEEHLYVDPDKIK